jgi:2-oxoglutarate dehydrogenase E2 component (dihydrolipoamide succinyltransferase)
MSVEIRVPRLAESVSEAVLVEWLKPDGAAVATDEPVAVLETDKAAVEIAASTSGALRHGRAIGDKVVVGDVLGRVEAGAAGAEVAAAAAAAAVAAVAAAAPSRRKEPRAMRPAPIPGAMRTPAAAPAAPDPGPAPAATPAAETVPPIPPEAVPPVPGADEERVVPMSRIRQRIAERLVRSQHTAAILTTFNEIDMSAVMALRARLREEFERRHGVRLGLMSFFARAAVLALDEIPELNAEIRGTDIAYRSRVHMGVAVQTGRGLVVPVVRRADMLTFAEIEREIVRLADRARTGSLSLEELSGGTFTLSNGGVYGSLLSTPILNPPQSGILGMHKIEKRPIALNDQVLIRPMMYVALSYDHRIVDGEQAVRFLIRVKERLEDPERMLLDV